MGGSTRASIVYRYASGQSSVTHIPYLLSNTLNLPHLFTRVFELTQERGERQTHTHCMHITKHACKHAHMHTRARARTHTHTHITIDTNACITEHWAPTQTNELGGRLVLSRVRFGRPVADKFLLLHRALDKVEVARQLVQSGLILSRLRLRVRAFICV